MTAEYAPNGLNLLVRDKIVMDAASNVLVRLEPVVGGIGKAYHPKSDCAEPRPVLLTPD